MLVEANEFKSHFYLYQSDGVKGNVRTTEAKRIEMLELL